MAETLIDQSFLSEHFLMTGNLETHRLYITEKSESILVYTKSSLPS